MTTPPPASSGRRVVWIVDDNPLEREHARRALANEFDTELFGDGSAVLERVTTGRVPDVLVLDWLMPDVSGIDVCRFLRSSPLTVETAVLLMTAQREVANVVEGLRAGANDYLAKPYAPEELRARVGALARSKALRERAEEAESFLRTVLASIPDAVLAVNTAGRIAFANDEATRVLAKPGRPIGGELLTVVVPALRFEAADAHGALPDIRIGDHIYEPLVRPLFAETGMSMTISLRAVTEKRNREARRLDFYAIVAHDLRTPLGAMLMRVDWLLAGRRGALPPEVRSDVQKIDLRIRELVSLINDFLDLSQMEGAGVPLSRERVDMNEAARTAVDEYAPLADASGLDLDLDAQPEPAWVEVDRARIGQVLANLLSNAIKFTARDGRIVVRVRTTPDTVETTVEDNGRGIPADVLPSLFRRYGRGPHVPAEIGGTGLGLMIVREIVEAHGGSVSVHSEVGRGSAFAFQLKREAPGAKP